MCTGQASDDVERERHGLEEFESLDIGEHARPANEVQRHEGPVEGLEPERAAPLCARRRCPEPVDGLLKPAPGVGHDVDLEVAPQERGAELVEPLVDELQVEERVVLRRGDAFTDRDDGRRQVREDIEEELARQAVEGGGAGL